MLCQGVGKKSSRFGFGSLYLLLRSDGSNKLELFLGGPPGTEVSIMVAVSLPNGCGVPCVLFWFPAVLCFDPGALLVKSGP